MKNVVKDRLRDLYILQGKTGKILPFILFRANGEPLVFSAATQGVFVKSPYVIVSSIQNDCVTVEVLAPVRGVLLRTRAVITLSLTGICGMQNVTDSVYDLLEVCKPFEQSLSLPFSLQADECKVIWKALHNRREDEAEISVACDGEMKDLIVEVSTVGKDYSFTLESGEYRKIKVQDLRCIAICSGKNDVDGMIHLYIQSSYTQTICFL